MPLIFIISTRKKKEERQEGKTEGRKEERERRERESRREGGRKRQAIAAPSCLLLDPEPVN